MGYTSTYDQLLATNDLEKSLEIHFSYNCYPPVPLNMVPLAIEAIYAVVNGEDSLVIELPAGVTWRKEKTVRAFNAVESWHLEAFVDFIYESRNQ